MKLKLKDDYKTFLTMIKAQFETTDARTTTLFIYDLFEPDNTMTFADLEIGQVFAFKIHPPPRGNVCVRLGAMSYAANAHPPEENGWIILTNADSGDVVIPGKIIDGKFVPDEEGE